MCKVSTRTSWSPYVACRRRCVHMMSAVLGIAQHYENLYSLSLSNWNFIQMSFIVSCSLIILIVQFWIQIFEALLVCVENLSIQYQLSRDSTHDGNGVLRLSVIIWKRFSSATKPCFTPVVDLTSGTLAIIPPLIPISSSKTPAFSESLCVGWCVMGSNLRPLRLHGWKRTICQRRWFRLQQNDGDLVAFTTETIQAFQRWPPLLSTRWGDTAHFEGGDRVSAWDLPR